jgi:hypothetical protein
MWLYEALVLGVCSLLMLLGVENEIITKPNSFIELEMIPTALEYL